MEVDSLRLTEPNTTKLYDSKQCWWLAGEILPSYMTEHHNNSSESMPELKTVLLVNQSFLRWYHLDLSTFLITSPLCVETLCANLWAETLNQKVPKIARHPRGRRGLKQVDPHKTPYLKRHISCLPASWVAELRVLAVLQVPFDLEHLISSYEPYGVNWGFGTVRVSYLHENFTIHSVTGTNHTKYLHSLPFVPLCTTHQRLCI